MTSGDATSGMRTRDRLACGLAAFLVVLLVAGGSAALLVSGFTASVEEAARRDARLIGDTVARSLAVQFEKAARYGIPLKMLPGVESYLAETLRQTPGLTRIIVRGPDMREIRSVISRVRGTDTSIAPIQIDGISFGQVDVTTTPATLSGKLARLSEYAAGAVVTGALVCGLLAGLFAGGSLRRGRLRLVQAMRTSAAKAGREMPTSAASGRGALRAAFQALAQGERRVARRRAAFEAYAEELLAVDFDGRLRADIARIRADALPPADRPREA